MSSLSYIFVFSVFQPAGWLERKLGRSAFRLPPFRFVVALSVILDDVHMFSLCEYRGKGKGCPCPWREATWWDEGCRSLIHLDTRLRRVVDFTPATVGASWSLEPKFRLLRCVCAYFVWCLDCSSSPCIRHFGFGRRHFIWFRTKILVKIFGV